MNYDEFAFFNQQLAGMLRSGIPLEGAIKQLSRSMRKSGLRSELELLEKDLREGIPLSEAVQRRKLPIVYTQIIRAGAGQCATGTKSASNCSGDQPKCHTAQFETIPAIVATFHQNNGYGESIFVWQWQL